VIETERLVLRPWRADDLPAFHAIGQDREVMRYLGAPLRWPEVKRAYRRMTDCQARHGHCFWAVEHRTDRRFIGFCGLKPGRSVLRGEIEIAWRLARGAWGQGLAREAAEASLSWGWQNLDAPAITAVTVPANTRSWRLMERLGMARSPDEDFDHPELPAGNPLRRHILYRIARPAT
jgi:RimJ/RimL family protein N-acetyltransferase